MNFRKKLKRSLLVLVLILIFPHTSYADEFNSIDINVDIDKNGLASVVEVWDTVDQKGTEKYKPIENLGQIRIEDFKARVNGKDFSEKDPWDLDASFEDKTYKYGMTQTSKGIELVWGISSYGSNKHEISYKINPIIIGLDDYDMLYWQFINKNMSPSPKSATITIRGYEPFNDEVRMWVEGEIHNEDGSIVMKSSGPINYGTVMLRFPKGYFNTSYKQDKTFKDYADQAIVGSKWEDKEGELSNDDTSKASPSLAIFIGLWIFFVVIVIFFMIYIISKIARGIKQQSTSEFDRKKKLPKKKDLKYRYYREVPYEGHIENLYLFNSKAFVSSSYSNLINAFILKWIYEGHMEVINLDDDSFLSTEGKDYLKIVDRPQDMGKLEEEFFDMAEEALDYSKNSYLDDKAFNKYAKKNKSDAKNFFYSFLKNSISAMKKEGYIEKTYYRRFLVKRKNLDPTDKGIELYERLIMFYNYLKDYSLIREREADEVKIWDYYMIYAALFGISVEVFKNLKEIYPDYETRSVYTYSSLNFTNNLSTTMTSSSGADFYSSGGGGSTSMGGGGGSFGGGSGGGSR